MIVAPEPAQGELGAATRKHVTVDHLGPRSRVINCMERNRSLRFLDPVKEVSFLPGVRPARRAMDRAPA